MYYVVENECTVDLKTVASATAFVRFPAEKKYKREKREEEEKERGKEEKRKKKGGNCFKKDRKIYINFNQQ